MIVLPLVAREATAGARLSPYSARLSVPCMNRAPASAPTVPSPVQSAKSGARNKKRRSDAS